MAFSVGHSLKRAGSLARTASGVLARSLSGGPSSMAPPRHRQKPEEQQPPAEADVRTACVHAAENLFAGPCLDACLDACRNTAPAPCDTIVIYAYHDSFFTSEVAIVS